MNEEIKTKKTALGIEENIEALLCYVLGFVTGIVFLIVEKENQFVRFHALQSIATFLSLFILSMVIGTIPKIGCSYHRSSVSSVSSSGYS